MSGPKQRLALTGRQHDDGSIEELISHRDVTTIMRLLGEIRTELSRIRWLLEDDDGEEEAHEDDS